MKTMSKILATILIVVLCVSLFTVQAFAAGHDETHTNVTHTPAKDPTCTEDGWEAYSKCEECGQYFAANGGWIDAIPTLTKLGHELIYHASTATCTAAGNGEYWSCSRCGKMFSDAAGTSEITAVPTEAAKGHDWGADVAATAATCQHEGNIKYKICKNCGAIQDGDGNFLSSMEQTKIAKTDHKWGTGVVIKEATSVSGGLIEYTCENCGTKKQETTSVKGITDGANIWPVIAVRDTYFRGEDLPEFASDLIAQLNAASGPNRNYVGVRIGTDSSLYANGYNTFDFWSWDKYIRLGENMLRNLDAGTYYLWVYNVNNPEEHTNSIPFYIVDVPTLEPINTDKHVVNSTKNLRFRASEPITAESVKVGGKSLYDPNYYYVSNDGLTITLSPDFLNERQAGTYTISANTRAGGVKVSCPFYILSTASGSSASPKTADESQLGLWAAFLLLSGAAVVVLIPKIRKHGA